MTFLQRSKDIWRGESHLEQTRLAVHRSADIISGQIVPAQRINDNNRLQVSRSQAAQTSRRGQGVRCGKRRDRARRTGRYLSRDTDEKAGDFLQGVKDQRVAPRNHCLQAVLANDTRIMTGETERERERERYQGQRAVREYEAHEV